ncbi:hypothetical protein LCGC14_2149890, partial [marine sediment metagenome]
MRIADLSVMTVEAQVSEADKRMDHRPRRACRPAATEGIHSPGADEWR